MFSQDVISKAKEKWWDEVLHIAANQWDAILMSVGWTKMVSSAVLAEKHANIHFDNKNRSYKYGNLWRLSDQNMANNMYLTVGTQIKWNQGKVVEPWILQLL